DSGRKPSMICKHTEGKLSTAIETSPKTARQESGVELRAPEIPGADALLTPAALAFVALLQRRFGDRRKTLIAARRQLQEKLDGGWNPDFLAETAEIRRGRWTVAPIPDDLQDRRVEITGPVDRKMVINALNSGAS